jgi:hypothetical protein
MEKPSTDILEEISIELQKIRDLLAWPAFNPYL